jgi:hypothetical protein
MPFVYWFMVIGRLNLKVSMKLVSHSYQQVMEDILARSFYNLDLENFVATK